jgi:DNA repair protein RadC
MQRRRIPPERMQTGFETAALHGNNATMHPIPVRATHSGHASCPSLHAAELLFRQHLANSRIERLVVAGFDARMRLVAFREADGQRTSVGGLLHMSRAVLGNSDVSIMVVGHNHPSGVATPSTADREATRRLAALCRLAGARLAGHLLFAGEECTPIGLS